MTENQYPRELDAILTDAVDRQLAEQRALREVLADLRESIEELADGSGTQAPPVDLSVFERQLTTFENRIDAAIRELASRPVQAPVDLSRFEERLVDLSRFEERILEAVRSIDVPSAEAPIDLPGLEDRIRGIIEVNIHNADENLRNAVQGSILGASETTFASLSEQLRALREALVPRLEHAVAASDAVRAVWEEMGAVRQLVGGVSTDVEGIAQALIDFNSGLRQWATGLEENIGAIRKTVGDIQQVALAPPPVPVVPAEPERKPVPKADDQRKGKARKGRDVVEEPEPLQSAVDDRIKETADLSAYLADQIEDLDGVMARLGELPQQLEGTVSQALRRTLTARAKLDREAETALDDVLASLDDHVNQLTGLLERFETEEDHIRRLALEQVELGSRIESLQESFLNRLEAVEAERRHGEEALASAIDRSHRGLSPRALESLAKPAKRRVRTSQVAPRKAAGSKQTAAAKSSVRKSAQKTKEGSKAKRAARRRSTRKSTRRGWTPISEAKPQADDDTRG